MFNYRTCWVRKRPKCEEVCPPVGWLMFVFGDPVSKRTFRISNRITNCSNLLMVISPETKFMFPLISWVVLFSRNLYPVRRRCIHNWISSSARTLRYIRVKSVIVCPPCSCAILIINSPSPWICSIWNPMSFMIGRKCKSARILYIYIYIYIYIYYSNDKLTIYALSSVYLWTHHS